jgi:Rod binding domain-containing protein
MESLNLQAYTNSTLNHSIERFSRSLPDRKQANRDDELFKVCQDFEAIFIKQMLSAMKKTVPKNDLLNGGFAEEIFEDMLYDEYAATMAKTARFGLSNLLYRQLKT